MMPEKYIIRKESEKLDVYLPNLQVLVAELLCRERQGPTVASWPCKGPRCGIGREQKTEPNKPP